LPEKKRTGKAEYAERIEAIKRLALIAMVSDDELMQRLVLKGGNALDLIHQIGTRASVDLDFSMEGEFSPEEVEGLEGKIEGLLRKTFRERGYQVFAVRFLVKPPEERTSNPDLFFWGGYGIEFKVLDADEADALAGNPTKMVQASYQVGDRGSPTFKIDISKHEFVGGRERHDIDGYTVYVYSTAMIVAEKLRAICQQMDAYRESIGSGARTEGRARDFFDIHEICTRHGVSLATEDSHVLIRAVFEAKKVPLKLLGRIEADRERHRAGFVAIRDTVRPTTELREFDDYFDYVVDMTRQLEALWHE